MDDQIFPNRQNFAFMPRATNTATVIEDDVIEEDVIEDDERITLERRTIARELHDTVAQPLSCLLMSFTCAERLPQQAGRMEDNLGLWKELAQEALDSLRNTLAGIHDASLVQFGVPDALVNRLAPQLSSRGIRLLVQTHEWPSELSADWNSQLYLIIREGLTNAEKHASATTVQVTLRAEPGMLFISITDNGIGFRAADLTSPQYRPRRGSGLGLSGMQDRIRRLGGELELITAPGCGVRLEIRVPNPMDTANVRLAWTTSPLTLVGSEYSGD